jgi:alginate O-acetyltransferase complex protein AlgI
MFFNTLTFIFFLPIVAILLFILPVKYQWLWILVCSILFYYTLLPSYLILFLILTLLNYFLGIVIETNRARRKTIFILSICLNISILAFFKYFGFLGSVFSEITKLSANDDLLKVFLPVGLSFFIFSILSYLIELKRETINAERHLGIFASALLFFPKIMQGPIERPGLIFYQFREEKKFDYGRIVDGMKLMLFGYVKKLVVADRLSIYVNIIYDNSEKHSGVSLLVATLFYSIQIYADFSGYTDIALGSAKILGFNLTNNFNRPYFATSVKEFWNRWHISFSTWLRDYLFLPLAIFFSRKIKRTRYIGITKEKWVFLFASLITFTICGIWHGDGTNYLIWGLLFSIYLSISNWMFGFNKSFRRKFHISKRSKLYKGFGITITFILVLFAWIFFRASSSENAFLIIHKILSFQGPLFIESPAQIIYGLFAIIFLFLVEFKREFYIDSFSFFYNPNAIVRNLSYTFLILLILLIGVLDGGQFIYFQF